MTVAAKKLAEQVLALPESDRETLFKLLRDSLSHEEETLSQEEWDEAWKKELEKRIEEIESGKVKCTPLRRGAKRLGQDFGKILKRIDLHPEADLEGRDALAFFRERATAEIAHDFDAKIDLALIEKAPGTLSALASH